LIRARREISSDPDHVAAVVGPTASGKTGLAIALARQFDGEIISMDSALVYRGMDIGTAKPPLAERGGIAHHLIDVIDPAESYSAARFRADALRLVGEIHARGKLPIITGGTMLYFKALREGLDDLPQADAGLRAEIEADAGARGWPALHAELAGLDPATGARLKPADAQRIGRALEIIRLTGKPMSAALSAAPEPLPFRLLALSLEPADRAVLHRRIAARFDAMLAAGLTDELAALRRTYTLTPRLPAMRCVGYRQAWAFLDGAIDLAQLREQGIIATRQLAKRQLTWLRGMADLTRLDCLRADLQSASHAIVKKFLTERT
jgi:tRNA dimethylallyltransferase